MLIYPESSENGLQNMATDWWLFENASTASFRHYTWSKTETSFGYGQDWKWVEETTCLSIDQLIRRPTGGGIVRHGNDWTYCLILPCKHHSFRISPIELYKEVHQCIGCAFAEANFKTTLQPCTSKKGRIIPGDCFQEPVGWDLMNAAATKKIAGAAIKRSRKGLLLQGTIEIGEKLNFDEKEFENNFIRFLSDVFQEQNDYVRWPENLEVERKRIYEQFSNLEWKKNRVRV